MFRTSFTMNLSPLCEATKAFAAVVPPRIEARLYSKPEPVLPDVSIVKLGHCIAPLVFVMPYVGRRAAGCVTAAGVPLAELASPPASATCC